MLSPGEVVPGMGVWAGCGGGVGVGGEGGWAGVGRKLLKLEKSNFRSVMLSEKDFDQRGDG